MNRRDKIILKKVIQEIDVAEKILKEETKESFLDSETIKRAVAMTAINIGELVKNVTRETREQYRDIPWKEIAGFRDVTAHGYQTLNMEDVYNTAAGDYPELKTRLSNILEAMEMVE